MVTFELFARAAIDPLSGCECAPLLLLRAKLTREFRHKTGLTRFLPAALSDEGSSVTPLRWQGSGDVPTAARANAFLVADADRESWKEGEDIRVMTEMKKLSHYDKAGRARMVDVSAKADTKWMAVAHAFVHIKRAVLKKLPKNPKGDPLEVARIAGLSRPRKLRS